MSRFESDPGGLKGSDGTFWKTRFAKIVAAVLFGSFFSIIIFFKSDPVDPETYCSDQPKTVLAVVIDISDPLSASQLESLRNRFSKIANSAKDRDTGLSLEKGDKLSVYFITNTDVPELVFQACSPGLVEEGDGWTRGRDRLKFEWAKFSRSMVEEIEKRAAIKDPLPKSHIIESIAFVRAAEFPPSDHVANTEQELRLVVISDFLQNSTLHSHHEKNHVNAEELNKKLPTSLHGVKTSALFITSESYSKLQNKELVTWWRAYFSSSVTGGQLVAWRAL